jgi:hypothetical protein
MTCRVIERQSGPRRGAANTKKNNDEEANKKAESKRTSNKGTFCQLFDRLSVNVNDIDARVGG